jgi:hypothetical protein
MVPYRTSVSNNVEVAPFAYLSTDTLQNPELAFSSIMGLFLVLFELRNLAVNTCTAESCPTSFAYVEVSNTHRHEVDHWLVHGFTVLFVIWPVNTRDRQLIRSPC